jgi:hypothetical protein
MAAECDAVPGFDMSGEIGRGIRGLVVGESRGNQPSCRNPATGKGWREPSR